MSRIITLFTLVFCATAGLAAAQTFDRMEVDYTENGVAKTATAYPGESIDINHDFDAGDLVFAIYKSGNGETTYELVDPSGNSQDHTGTSSYWIFSDPPETGQYFGRCSGGSWSIVNVTRVPEPYLLNAELDFVEYGVPLTVTGLPGETTSVAHDFGVCDLTFAIYKGGEGTTDFELLTPSGTSLQHNSSASYWVFTVAPEVGIYIARCAGEETYFQVTETSLPEFDRMEVDHSVNGELQTTVIDPGETVDITHDFAAGDLRFAIYKSGVGETIFELLDPSSSLQEHTGSSNYWVFDHAAMTGVFAGRCADGEWAYVAVSRNGGAIHVAEPGSDEAGDGSESNPYATIRHAFGIAQAGDTVSVAHGSYAEHSIDWPDGVTLIGDTTQPDAVTINAAGQGRVFSCTDLQFASLSGVTIRSGSETPWGSGILCQGTDMMISDCLFKDNGSTAGNTDGGAIACFDSEPVITHCRFSGNYVQRDGGALYFSGGNQFPVVSFCVFENNEARNGGAVWVLFSQPEFENCTFVANETSVTVGMGQAIFCNEGGHAVFRRCILALNSGHGDPVQCQAEAQPTFECSVFYGNSNGDWIGCIEGQVGQAGNGTVYPYFCDWQDGNYMLSTDSPCAPGVSSCGLIGAMGLGCSELVPVEQESPVAVRALSRCYPNPFNPSTTITFTTEPNDHVELRIYDLSGRLVRTLYRGNVMDATNHQVAWDGRDDTGSLVASGVYLCRMSAGEFEDSHRMVLLK